MENNKSEAIILFDGVCNLCNSLVNYIIDHDPHSYFKFGTFQSSMGKEYLEKVSLDFEELRTIILIEENKIYTLSTAVLKIVRRLVGPIKYTWAFILIPQFIRDPIYKCIARNRYKWFGKRKKCRVPTPELLDRFI